MKAGMTVKVGDSGLRRNDGYESWNDANKVRNDGVGIGGFEC